MRKYVALAVVTAFLAVVVSSASSTPVNWKTNVKTACSRLVVNANWTVEHPYPGRLAKLHRSAKACRMALKEMP